jgi:glutathione S-transferase
MIKLYYVPKTRSTRARWALEELGLPYELIRLDPSKGEAKTPEHRARHPLEHVPVVETEHGLIFESAAICLHLAAGSALLPADGSRDRALLHQWLFFGITELEPLLGKLAGEKRKSPVDQGRIDAIARKLERPLKVLDTALTGHDWLVGDRFSVADLIVGSLLVWAARLRLLKDQPHAHAVVERITERPAFQRAMAD